MYEGQKIKAYKQFKKTLVHTAAAVPKREKKTIWNAARISAGLYGRVHLTTLLELKF